MRVLVATRRTQRDGDHADAVDGELVTLPVVADAGRGSATCDERTFVGVDSGGATTTAEVVELDVTDDVIAGYIAEALARRGASNWDLIATVAKGLTTEVLDIARRFPVGTVVEKRGTLLLARDPHGGRGTPPRRPERPP